MPNVYFKQSFQGEFITIYAAVRNEDLTEGTGRRVDHSYYSTEENAELGAKGIDVMGSDGKIAARDAIVVNGKHVFLLDHRMPQDMGITLDLDIEKKRGRQTSIDIKARKEALDKLTPHEKELLGLKQE